MQRATSLIGSVAGMLAGVGLLAILLLGRSFLGERESFWVILGGAFAAGAAVLFAVQCFGGLFRPLTSTTDFGYQTIQRRNAQVMFLCNCRALLVILKRDES